ncbi:MAG: endospore germination permease [Bacillota bacterium]|nr:endospore germination permease [Bacillota bacterium]
MRKEQISDKEAMFVLIIYYIGSSFILGVGGEAKNDAWISVILGVVMAVPVILIYARLLSLFPEKDLFDILDWAFGKWIGKLFALVYIWYSFHLGALVIRNFGEFTNTIAIPETPMIVPMLCIGIICTVAVTSGIEVIGRISAAVLPILIIIVSTVSLMAIPKMYFHFLKPILGNGFLPIIKGGFSVFSFPFAESVLLMGVFSSLKTNKSPYRVYLLGTVIAGLLILMITFRNITVLGSTYSKFYFPAHIAVSMVSLGDFLQRIELAVAVDFVFGVFIKTSICLLVTCKGIAKLLRLNDYRSIVIQVALLMVYFSYTLYDSIMEMAGWAFKVYAYYAFPFQVIFPIILFVTVEIKVRRGKKKLQTGVGTDG